MGQLALFAKLMEVQTYSQLGKIRKDEPLMLRKEGIGNRHRLLW
jgi:hypothetical protein